MNKPKGEQQGLYKQQQQRQQQHRQQQQHEAKPAWQFSSELEIAKTVSVCASTVHIV